jgi:hypothetical protein
MALNSISKMWGNNCGEGAHDVTVDLLMIPTANCRKTKRQNLSEVHSGFVDEQVNDSILTKTKRGSAA